MRKVLLGLLFTFTLSLVAASPANPADFPVTIHVVYSSGLIPSGQRIEALIDGKPVELTSNASGLLSLGDYPARVSPKIAAPKNWSPYDLYKGYDFLMPDGKVRTYIVTAMGTVLIPQQGSGH